MKEGKDRKSSTNAYSKKGRVRKKLYTNAYDKKEEKKEKKEEKTQKKTRPQMLVANEKMAALIRQANI